MTQKTGLNFGQVLVQVGFQVYYASLRQSLRSCQVSGFRFQVSGFKFRVSSFGFRVSSFGFTTLRFVSRLVPKDETRVKFRVKGCGGVAFLGLWWRFFFVAIAGFLVDFTEDLFWDLRNIVKQGIFDDL